MRRGLVLLVLATVTCAIPNAERTFFTSETHPLPIAADCERCHQEVYREWHESAHADAWSSEGFRRATANGRAESCSGCHAPAPVDEHAPVAVRDRALEEGVSCVSCHVSTREGAAPLTMRGPATRTSPIEIHPIVEEDLFYRSNALCGRCHEVELQQWEAARASGDGEEKQSCPACHMPAVRRKVESIHDEHSYSAIFVAMGREQDLRRHEFAVPQKAAEWVLLEVAPAGSRRLRVSVSNHMPHALPTGAFGRRAVQVVASWPGGRLAESVAGRRLGPIGSGQTRTLELELPVEVEPADVQVSLERWDRKQNDWTPLLSADTQP